MKFSEAMILGSTMIKFDPSCHLTCGRGCLRGAAYFADTGMNVMPLGADSELWPWLDEKFPVPPRTRYSAFERLTEGRYIINAIAWAVESGDWTFEQAIAWVRSVEPAEPELCW